MAQFVPHSAQARKIDLRDFSREIMTDLPDLMKEHPMGVTVSDLFEYYGEGVQRIARALEILVNADKIERKRRASKATYIYPKGWHLPRPYPELTLTQYNLLKLLQELRPPGEDIVKTNYSRLAEELHISLGGTKSSFERLCVVGHVKLAEPFSSDYRTMSIKVITKPTWEGDSTDPEDVEDESD